MKCVEHKLQDVLGTVVARAKFSEDYRYRYKLSLYKDRSSKFVNFIMLNPSTATHLYLDPTMEKCVKLARSWGYENLRVTNLFAYRATDPKDMKKAKDPIGEYNDQFITRTALHASLVVCAWGRDGKHMSRSQAIVKLLANKELHILRMTKQEPWHPLYLSDTTQPQLWRNKCL